MQNNGNITLSIFETLRGYYVTLEKYGRDRESYQILDILNVQFWNLSTSSTVNRDGICYLALSTIGISNEKKTTDIGLTQLWLNHL